MDDGREFALGIVEGVEEALDAVQREIDSARMQAPEALENGVAFRQGT